MTVFIYIFPHLLIETVPALPRAKRKGALDYWLSSKSGGLLLKQRPPLAKSSHPFSTPLTSSAYDLRRVYYSVSDATETRARAKLEAFIGLPLIKWERPLTTECKNVSSAGLKRASASGRDTDCDPARLGSRTARLVTSQCTVCPSHKGKGKAREGERWERQGRADSVSWVGIHVKASSRSGNGQTTVHWDRSDAQVYSSRSKLPRN